MQLMLESRARLSGEALAKQMLSAVTGIAAANLCILRDTHGKPYLPDSAFSFSISHSGDRLLCAVHEGAVGADIELYGAYRDAVARRVCTAAEYRYIGGDAARFYAVWTRKEAYAKLDGRGLGIGLRSIPVADENGLLPQIKSCTVKTVQLADCVYSVVWKDTPISVPDTAAVPAE